VECTCYKGKDRVRQYIDLITKEMQVIDDVVFHGGKYYMRVLGVDKEAKISKMTDQPLHVTLATETFTFTEQEVGVDNIHIITPNEQKIRFRNWLQTVPQKYLNDQPRSLPLKLRGIKTVVIKSAELLDKNKNRVFKQIFPEIYFGLPAGDFPRDTITFTWQLGS